MVAIQIGIIIFLIFVLAIICQDEYRKRRLTRKSARLSKFWNNTGERRRNFRINTELDVLYEVVSNEVIQKRNSMSRNISLGGINLALNEKLVPDTTLRLEFNIPKRPKPIFTQGKIVWVEERLEKLRSQKEERFFTTGIKFTQMKPEDEAALYAFIKQNSKEQSQG